MNIKIAGRKVITTGIVVATLLLPISGFAFLPVIDVTAVVNLVRQLDQMKKQYDLMNQTYQTTQRELNRAKELTGDEEGHYGFGNLMDGGQYTVNREWSPDSWQDTLQGLSGGNPQRYQQLISQYQSANPTISQSDYERGESQGNATVYENQIQNNQAASVTASYAFNNIKEHIQHIRDISKQIEDAPNEKSAVDLNTRMEAEIAYVQVEMLKQLALMNEQMASRGANNIQYETQAAKFNRLPDA